ncbi:phage integrase SAM-like domain-containing protein [Flagellimonas flava]|uniref:phage integrase SAM-like domain-containing protein n=1 Tax=Flagellimonas flava TaxID=570519 RepID=UPI003D648A0A
MAKITLTLDTRKHSKSKLSGKYPVVLSVYHKKPRFIRMDVYTLASGWDESKSQLKKSAPVNKNLDCDSINIDLDRKFFKAKELLREIGDSVGLISVDRLIQHIKEKWDENPESHIKNKVENEISLIQWSNIVIQRSLNADSPHTAGWYQQGVDEIVKYNNGEDIMLYDLTVTFLKNFEAHHRGKGNSVNTIGIILRAVRSIYNKAIVEEYYKPTKSVFESYKIPATIRTKKRAISKEEILRLCELEYEPFGPLWNARNYALIMFYCKGMNFIDLVKVKTDHIQGDRLHYGRSKTGTPLSVKIHPKLRTLLFFYLAGKKKGDYLFPTNYDGSTKHFQKYKSQRRRMNERLRVIAEDAGIEAKFTTYTIRHSWATIAKYIGISTALISESLGHASLRTTEIYLKDFENEVLDEVNELVTT